MTSFFYYVLFLCNDYILIYVDKDKVSLEMIKMSISLYENFKNSNILVFVFYS